MIKSADEFIKLRTSEIKEEYDRSAHDTADISTWTEVIEKYPDFKEWVIHNKIVPMEILETLTLDNDPKIRTKRKVNDKIFRTLSRDKDENVRHALMWNTNLTVDKLRLMETSDSEWLTKQLNERIQEIENKG